MSPRLQALARQHSQTLTISATRGVLPPAGQSVYLDFVMEPQRKSKWCWAATSVSVSRFYHPASYWTQCAVAHKAFGGYGICCVPLAGFVCNRYYFLDKALSITGNFVIQSGILPFPAVETALRGGRVIGARVQWQGGGGHFMAIHGCFDQGTMQVLDIDDPIYGKSSVAETVFLNSYQGRGSWSHSYHTKP